MFIHATFIIIMMVDSRLLKSEYLETARKLKNGKQKTHWDIVNLVGKLNFTTNTFFFKFTNLFRQVTISSFAIDKPSH